MAESANRTDPQLWESVKAEVTRGAKGGRAGQWSARKAQMAVAIYKQRGGGYIGEKGGDNHLAQWTREKWGTRSGRPSGETQERYLPRRARETLTDAEYKRTSAKKRTDTAKGQQFSRQPVDVAGKTTQARVHQRFADGDGSTKAALMAEARKRGISGRSGMSKAQLAKALQR